MLKGIAVAVAFAVSATVAYAQNVQNVSIVTPEQSLEEVLKTTAPSETVRSGGDVPLELGAPRLQAPAELANRSAVLSGVDIDCVNCGPDGAPSIPETTLLALIADSGVLGQPVPLSEVFGVLDTIEGAYRDAGYVFVAAIARPQSFDPQGHVFEVTILESRLGDIFLDVGNETAAGACEGVTLADDPAGTRAVHRVACANVSRYRDTEEPLRLADLERVLLLLNDTPGVVRATGTPRGAGGGLIDLYVDVDFKRYDGLAFADTRQSPVIGEGLAGVNVSVNSIIRSGDRTTLSLFNSFGDDADDLGERHTGQIEYQVPVNGHGTTVSLRALASRSRPGDVLEPIDVETTQRQVEVTAEHPFLRTRDLSVWGRVGFQADETESTIAGGTLRTGDDSLRTAILGARVRARGAAVAYAIGDLELRKGLSILGASEDDDPDLSRFDGQADYTLVRAEALAEAFAPFGNAFIRDRLSLYGRAAAQYSFDPLLSTEEFVVGGTRGGRGFDPAEISGDHGVFGILELRHRTDWEVGVPLPEIAGGGTLPIATVVYGFGEYGKVWNIGDGFPDEADLFTYGAGIRLLLSDRTEIGAEIAQPTTELVRTRDDDLRFAFSLVQRF